MKRLQNGIVTSDEDVSITGSPNIRRRLGSCSGGIVDQQSTKEDIYSPGTRDENANRFSLFLLKNSYYKLFLTDVTPNGTLRRRRSRIPCEDDDGNLMDFLRTSGQDGSRERKSWGSLGTIVLSRSRLSLLYPLCEIRVVRNSLLYDRSFVGEKGSRTISKKRSVKRRLFH